MFAVGASSPRSSRGAGDLADNRGLASRKWKISSAGPQFIVETGFLTVHSQATANPIPMGGEAGRRESGSGGFSADIRMALWLWRSDHRVAGGEGAEVAEI